MCCRPPDQAEKADLYATLDRVGSPSFQGSFIERRRRLYQEMSQHAERLMELQKDLLAVERILGG